jgi:hypothetical protein
MTLMSNPRFVVSDKLTVPIDTTAMSRKRKTPRRPALWNTAHLPARGDRFKLGGVAQQAARQSMAARSEKHDLNPLPGGAGGVKGGVSLDVTIAATRRGRVTPLCFAVPHVSGLVQFDDAGPFGLDEISRQNRVSGHDDWRLLHCGSLIGAWLYEVRPDAMRIVWTEFLTRHFPASGLFDGQAVLSGNISSLEPICYCGLDHPYLVGERFLASSDGNCFV